MRAQSFFGIFTYLDAETESCAFSTYFTDVNLKQEIVFPDGRKLSAGHHFDEAYLNHKTGILQFVKSWQCFKFKAVHPYEDLRCCNKAGTVTPAIEYSIPAADLYPIRWDAEMRAMEERERK